MNSRKGKWHIGFGMFVGALVIGMLAVLAAPAHAASSEGDDEMAEDSDELAGCTRVASTRLQGRDVVLWRCNGLYHGQIARAAAGDAIRLEGIHGIPTDYVQVRAGSTSANTADYSASSATDFDACGRIASTGATACTCIRC